MQRTIHFDEGAKGFLLLLLISQLFFNNGVYLFVGGLCFGALFYFLQQPLKPSVFTIIFLYHFIQVAATVWLSNFIGEEINYRSPNTITAIICSYIGLFFVFVPIILYQNKIPAISVHTLKKHAAQISIDKTFKIYLVAFFAMNALEAVAFLFSGLSQIIFSIIKIKWFFFLLFGVQVFIKNDKKKIFFLFAAFEFLSGFYSYFSEFKTVLFYGAFIFFFFLLKVTLKPLILGLSLGIGVFFLGAYFQGIKGEYRTFLNKGSKTQTVAVSQEDALGKLVELAQEQQEGTFSKSVESFLDRFQYTYHLAKSMEVVPEKIPFQNGSNWGETIDYVFTPRIMNPDKPKYEASVKASKYTGIKYAGNLQGVSVSLGYFADGYIDFGVIGMFVPLLILGFIYGSSYFYFVRKSSNNYIFNFAVVGAMYMEFFAFEMDSTYLLGRLFATLLTFYLLKLFFFPWLIRYLQMSVQPKSIQPTSEMPALS